ncbi:MAG: rhodanese-like domain-containing protein [Flavobacteriales bacterium]
MYQEISVETFKRMSQEENAVVLDVRTPGEVDEFALDYDVQVDFFNRDELLQTLGNLDKAKAYLVYCHSGQRSASTCCLMADMGFEKLYNLKGGIAAWD